MVPGLALFWALFWAPARAPALVCAMYLRSFRKFSQSLSVTTREALQKNCT
jgi:hypothetical protein